MKPLTKSTRGLFCTQAVPKAASRRIAGLVVADQRGDGRGLAGLGEGAGLLQILVGLVEESRVPAGRDFAVGRAGAIDLFDEFAVASFDQARVQRVLLVEALQIGETDAGVEIVGAGLQDVGLPCGLLAVIMGSKAGVESEG